MPALLRLSETPPSSCLQPTRPYPLRLAYPLYSRHLLPAAPTFASTTTPGASPLGSGGPQPTILLQLGPPARASSSMNGNASVGRSALANAASAREAGAVRVREREQQLQRETRSVTHGRGRGSRSRFNSYPPPKQRACPSSLARTASPWRARPRSSSRWPAALRSLHALVLPSSRSGPFTRSCLATHVLRSALPRTHLLARTFPCSPARLPPALLTPGADTPCLLARTLDLGPPRLVPAPAVTHRSPIDRSCPNSLAHVHDPTSAISARTPALSRLSEMLPSPCLQPPTGPYPSISVHNPASSRNPLSSSPRSPSLARRRVLTSVSTLVPPFSLFRASGPVTHALGS
ncbi:hypothetical protein FS749_010419 [Ceratobasidium sp. UAMH 11750]|nr:hypothetical protein FS749_010419 [Ceratobasidium sp. UAMH 11750]